MKAYTRFGPLVAREVGEEQLDFDEVDHHCEDDQVDQDGDGVMSYIVRVDNDKAGSETSVPCWMMKMPMVLIMMVLS